MGKLFKLVLGVLFIGIALTTTMTSCRGRRSHERTLSTLEIVSQRRAEQEKMHINEVYYSMDETVLIAVINKLGTKVTKAEVVFEYESNAAYYDGLKEGAKNVNEYVPEEADIPAPPNNIPDEPVAVG